MALGINEFILNKTSEIGLDIKYVVSLDYSVVILPLVVIGEKE